MFKLTPNGVKLVEETPGVDLEREVLGKIEFRPVVQRVEEMDRRIFCKGKRFKEAAERRAESAERHALPPAESKTATRRDLITGGFIKLRDTVSTAVSATLCAP